MKNQKGATSLQILLTVVILLILAGTAIAMIAGSFEKEETVNETKNETRIENLEELESLEDEKTQTTEEQNATEE